MKTLTPKETQKVAGGVKKKEAEYQSLASLFGLGRRVVWVPWGREIP